MSALLLMAISSSAAFLPLMVLQFHCMMVKLLSVTVLRGVLFVGLSVVSLFSVKSMNVSVEGECWGLQQCSWYPCEGLKSCRKWIERWWSSNCV